MTTNTKKRLLRSKKVVEEINRHRWIESEKSGYDIGFERASTDWLEKFSKAWMQYHMPKRKIVPSTSLKSTSKRKSSLREAILKVKKRAKLKSKKS